MNAVEKLIAKGESKGKAEGNEQGYWIGRIQLLQEFLGLELAAKDELSSETNARLKEIYEAQQVSYDENFKK